MQSNFRLRYEVQNCINQLGGRKQQKRQDSLNIDDLIIGFKNRKQRINRHEIVQVFKNRSLAEFQKVIESRCRLKTEESQMDIDQMIMSTSPIKITPRVNYENFKTFNEHPQELIQNFGSKGKLFSCLQQLFRHQYKVVLNHIEAINKHTSGNHREGCVKLIEQLQQPERQALLSLKLYKKNKGIIVSRKSVHSCKKENVPPENTNIAQQSEKSSQIMNFEEYLKKQKIHA